MKSVILIPLLAPLVQGGLERPKVTVR